MAVKLLKAGLKLKFMPFKTLPEGETFALDEMVGVWIKIASVYKTFNSLRKVDEINAVKITTGELVYFKDTDLINVVAGAFAYTNEREL